MTRYVNAKTVKSELGICSATLNNWRRQGRIVYEQINPRKFMYDIESLKGIQNPRMNVIYCRVSNTKQNEDLVKQEQILREYCVKNGIRLHAVFSEIASGMNENRKKFNELLDLVIDNKISKIYISYKDRLSRFGFCYFEKLFDKFGCTIEVLSSTDEKTYEEELTEDLISIIHHFSMKMYSNRRKQLKAAEKCLKETSDDCD